VPNPKAVRIGYNKACCVQTVPFLFFESDGFFVLLQGNNAKKGEYWLSLKQNVD
jgi:hypothetical protein